jgi:hypothetical protein
MQAYIRVRAESCLVIADQKSFRKFGSRKGSTRLRRGMDERVAEQKGFSKARRRKGLGRLIRHV